MPYPRLVRVRQKFPRPKVASVPAAVRDALQQAERWAEQGQAGARASP